MLKLPIKTLCLCLCFVEAIWLLVAQATGSLVLLLPCLVCFLLLMVWAAMQNVAIPVLLFFIPFAPLLKMAPNTISFYTLALMAVYAICMVKGWRNVRILHLIPAIVLIALTITVKIVLGYALENSYLLFAFSLLLVPFMATELDGRYDFYWATIFLVLGVALAAITSKWLGSFPSIARYINIVDEMGIHRRAGYYNDPNFYSAHITAAIGGLLVLLLSNIQRVRRMVLLAMTLLMLYCGLQSISKSFLLISICLFMCWLFAFLFQKGRVSAKIVTILTLIVIFMFILSSSVFTDLLDLLVSRLSRGTTLSDFTTRRVDLWQSYILEFRNNPWVLLFGNGYSDVLVNGRGSHNTIIQMVYQLGLVGSVVLIVWFVLFIGTILGSRARRLDWAQGAILLLGAFGPWMALDYLFFDELFLIPLYLCIAIRFLNKESEPTLETVTTD